MRISNDIVVFNTLPDHSDTHYTLYSPKIAHIFLYYEKELYLGKPLDHSEVVLISKPLELGRRYKYRYWYTSYPTNSKVYLY